MLFKTLQQHIVYIFLGAIVAGVILKIFAKWPTTRVLLTIGIVTILAVIYNFVFSPFIDKVIAKFLDRHKS